MPNNSFLTTLRAWATLLSWLAALILGVCSVFLFFTTPEVRRTDDVLRHILHFYFFPAMICLFLAIALLTLKKRKNV